MVDQDSAALIRDPAGCIKAAFADALTNGTRPAADDDYGIPGRFEDAFADDAELDKVPGLDAGDAGGFRLVRLQCYVVHADTEIYGGAWRSEDAGWRLGRYGLDVETDVAREIELAQSMPDGIAFEERLTLSCRSITTAGDSLEEGVANLALGPTDSRRDDLVVVKLYNEKEEGLLHAFIDVVGIVEPSDGRSPSIVHGLIVQQQRLATFLTGSSETSTTTTTSDPRASFLAQATLILDGDAHAAELLLLSLTASVGTREPVLVGPLPLNLRSATPTISDRLSRYLLTVTPLLRLLNISIDGLNKGDLTPRHDGESFTSGQLQLPTDSLLLVDETALSEGKLTEVGVRDLQSLSAVQDRQKLPFHFPFNRLELDVDYACVTVSIGRSLLNSNNTILSCPIVPSTGTTPQPDPQTGDAAVAVRKYLASARLRRVEIGQALSTRIQDDFVRLRKARPTATTSSSSAGGDGDGGEVDLVTAALGDVDGDDLAMRLRLAREVARSLHHTVSSTTATPGTTTTTTTTTVDMTWDHYEHAAKLWDECKRRNAKV